MVLCDCTLKSLGYLVVAYVAYRIFRLLYNIIFPYFLASPVDLHEKAGAKWAVVTGATDGIGKAYAQQLAKKGFNVLLISRTQSKLDDVKKEIAADNKNIKVDTLAFDFTAGSNDAYKPLYAALKKIDVGVLVNNVGMSFEYPDILHKTDGGTQRLADMNTCNTLPVVLLSSEVLTQMVERKRGIIINIASFAGYNAMPLWNVYSASKRFVIHLTETLRKEYADQGIMVQCICPMLVATKMARIRRSSLFAPFADGFVQSALRTVGIVDETTGYWAHQLQSEIVALLPDWLMTRVVAQKSLALKAAALKKKAT